KTGRDVLGVGIALSDLGYNPRDAWWGVPRIGSIELSIIPKHLRELREVRVQTKAHRHRTLIMMQPVSRDLRSSFDAVIQVPQERGRIGAESLPHMERRNQLGF